MYDRFSLLLGRHLVFYRNSSGILGDISMLSSMLVGHMLKNSAVYKQNGNRTTEIIGNLKNVRWRPTAMLNLEKQCIASTMQH